jgi:hypothetical protein
VALVANPAKSGFGVSSDLGCKREECQDREGSQSFKSHATLVFPSQAAVTAISNGALLLIL